MVKFFRCEKCGNIVELINDSGAPLSCCGENMKQLIAGSVDAAVEKHVPSIKIEDGKLIATIGSVLHPMEEKHYIQWIAFVNEESVKRVNLKPGSDPIAYAPSYFKGEVYEYCNLHGLWKTTVE